MHECDYITIGVGQVGLLLLESTTSKDVLQLTVDYQVEVYL